MTEMRQVRLSRLFERKKILGHVNEPMLSVFREHGVVLKDQMINHNLTAEDRSIYQLVEPGWLAVNRMKAWQGSLGISPHRGIISGHYICFAPRHREDDRYLHYALRAPHMTAHFLSISRGVRPGQIEIDNDQLAATPLTLPSRDEQRRIADFLDDRVARIDQIISARRAQAALQRDLTRSQVVKRLLAGEFIQISTSPWFDCADGSHTVRVSNRWSVIDCKHRTPEYVDSGYAVISPGDISPGHLDLTRATRFVGDADYLDLADDLRRCRQGDLVYSRNASAGTAAYVGTNAPFTMGQDVCRITSADEDQLYLAYCLNFLTEPQLDSARVGSTFTRINVDQIKALAIPFRARDQQTQIAKECELITDAGISHGRALGRSIRLLQEYKQSLITAAVTGELDVTTAGSGIPG